MPIPERQLEAIRKSVLRSFGKVPGVASVNFFKNSVTLNTYRDKTADNYSPSVPSKCYISFSAPIKVVKSLGWWKEDESLPIIAYMPYEEGIVPAKYDKLVVAKENGYMDGIYYIEHVKQFGQNNPVCWVFTISPNRI